MDTDHYTRRTRRTVAAGGVVIAALIGGSVTSTLARTDLTIVVDDQAQHVNVAASSVAAALAESGLTPGPHDLVMPAGHTAVRDGDTITLTRARPIELTVNDGASRTVWVAATDVDGALDALDLDQRGASVSASRSSRIPGDGLALQVRTPQTITVVADGTSRQVRTTASTVDRALAQAGVSTAPTDRVTPALSTYPRDGQTVTIERVRTQEVIDRSPLPAEEVHRDTAALPAGTSRVIDEGAAGVLATTVLETLVDGVLTDRVPTGSVVELAPRARIVENGTAQPAPRPAPRATPSPSRPATAAPPASAGGLNWDALAQCESGGNPSAVSASGTYRGLYQFSRATWASVGGVGDPAAATVQEQTLRAQILHERSGPGQWPVCGRRL